MNRLQILSRGLAALVLASSIAACGGSDDKTETRSPGVVEWNTFAADLLAGSGAPPPVQTRGLAIVQIAVHDAINSIDPRYARYAFNGNAKNASVAAAVAAATRDALVAVAAPAASAVDAKYNAALASIPDGTAKQEGVAVGKLAAQAILALHAGESVEAALTAPYVLQVAKAGVYQPTTSDGKVFAAGIGNMIPFAMGQDNNGVNSLFRGDPPPDVVSAQYAQDYQEVKALGDFNAPSHVRTKQQTETAKFWYDAATREWHAAARQVLTKASADEWRTAYTLAALSIAMVDAGIASMEGKFHHNFWRPVTAIHYQDDDGNPATQPDPNWQPLCVTPPFPEYNSTHAATGAAAAGVLARVLGDAHTFTVTSSGQVLPGVTRTYTSFKAAAEEEGLSRIYCGIHFRSAMRAGLLQGDALADLVVSTHIKPINQ
jgi:hypothetical protein